MSWLSTKRFRGISIDFRPSNVVNLIQKALYLNYTAGDVNPRQLLGSYFYSKPEKWKHIPCQLDEHDDFNGKCKTYPLAEVDEHDDFNGGM
jgi:hypothetical protein